MFKIIVFLLSVAFLEVALYALFLHTGIMKDIFNLVVYKEYFNEYLILSLLFILLFKRNKILDFILMAFLGLILLIDFIQFIAYFYSGSFLTLDALDNANQALLFFNKYILIACIIFVFIYGLAIFLSVKIKNVTKKERIYAFLFVVSLVIINFYTYYKNKNKNLIFDEFAVEKGPVLSFIKTLHQYFSPIKITNVNLSEEEKEFAVKNNLIVNFNSQYPLMKSFFYKRKLEGNHLEGKPNILIFFVESLSAKYVDVYSNNSNKITPNLDKLAKKGFFVKNYINHTFPTIRALYGQLCSVYPEYRTKEVVDDYNGYKFYNLKCLPEYLNEYGYNTIYFNHGNKKRQEIGRLSEKYGFKKRFFNLDLEKLLNEKPMAALDKDFSDQQMARAVIKFLKNYHSKKPFFIAVSTIETHIGYQLRDDAVKKEGFDEKLNTYYNLDNALGKVFNYIENSKFAKNTIIIVTGDHVRPEKDKKYHSTTYGDLALIIYSPFFATKPFYANTSSIDLAPTILHLINYPNKINAFEGRSIFERNNSLAIGATLENGMFYAKFKGYEVLKSSQFDKPKTKLEKYIYDIIHYIYYLQRTDRLLK